MQGSTNLLVDNEGSVKRLVLVFVLLCGCVVVPARPIVARRPPSEVPPQPPPVAASPAAIPAPPAPVAAPQNVIRAKEIRAETIRARIIYAKEVKAAGGRVDRVFEGKTKEWERGRSDEEVRAGLIEADVIYAKEVRADWIDAAEIRAKEVRIGR